MHRAIRLLLSITAIEIKFKGNYAVASCFKKMTEMHDNEKKEQRRNEKETQETVYYDRV